MGLNKIMHRAKFEIQCITSYGKPIIHHVIANVVPPEIKHKGIYNAPKNKPNMPLINAQSNEFELCLVILDIIIVTIIKISQMYRYAIDQKLNPYIKISRARYMASGHIALTPKINAYTIRRSDTGSIFGSGDIINFKANNNAPNIPYKHISLVFIFIIFF